MFVALLSHGHTMAARNPINSCQSRRRKRKRG